MKLNLILIVLSFYMGFSQNKMICKYKIMPIESELKAKKNDSELEKSSKDLILKATLLASNFDYILKFNKNESVTELVTGMNNDGDNAYLFNIAKAIIDNGICYQNTKLNIVLIQKNVMGEPVIIKDVLRKNWIITNEERTIGSYRCKKAYIKCETCKSTEIVWFTPDIPVPFGPKGYGGLPGLIVQINQKSNILRLVKIKTTTEDFQITKPERGKVITLGEYNKMTDRIRANAKVLSN